jgi:hypothetical protein
MLKAIIASLKFNIRQLEFPYKIMIGFVRFGLVLVLARVLVQKSSFVLAKKLSFVAALLQTHLN